VSAPTGAQVIDIKGRWLLPGFVDAHVHLRDLAAARHAVQSGATTVRALGSSYFTDVGMRELHRAGLTDIPEVVAAGYQIRPDLSQGNGDFFLDFPGMSRFMSGLRGSENLRSVVRLLAEHHVDLIKILATERAGTPQTDPRKRTFTDEEMVAIVDEARKAGLPVAAHAHGDEGARGAVLAGVHSIEHGTYLSDDTLALMKTHGTYFVPTLSAVSHMSKLENPVSATAGPCHAAQGARHSHPRMENGHKNCRRDRQHLRRRSPRSRRRDHRAGGDRYPSYGSHQSRNFGFRRVPRRWKTDGHD